jgi:predicted porin
MKKSLIALAALAAVSGAAQAQSSVTVYGIIDSGYSSSKAEVLRYSSTTNTYAKDKQDTSGITGNGNESTSRLGFRGTEDLGGGLKANFVFETALNSATSTISAFNNRQAFVGLSGGFGTVNVGTLYSPSHGIAAAFNPNTLPNVTGDAMYVIGAVNTTLDKVGLTVTSALAATDDSLDTAAEVVALTKGAVTIAVDEDPGTAALAVINTTVGALATADLNKRLALANTTSYTVRNNNTISYVSPAFNGLTVTAQITGENSVKVEGRSEVTTSGNNFAVNYASGPFAFAAGMASSKAKSSAVTAASRAATLQRSITDPSAADTSTYTVVNHETAAKTQAATEVEAKNKEVMLAASYDLGVAKVSYIYTKRDTKDTVSDLSDKTTHSFGVKAPFGKTTAFALYTTGEQKVLPGASETKFDLDGIQAGVSYAMSKRTDIYAIYGTSKMDNVANANDIKDKQYAVGLRHQF